MSYHELVRYFELCVAQNKSQNVVAILKLLSQKNTKKSQLSAYHNLLYETAKANNYVGALDLFDGSKLITMDLNPKAAYILVKLFINNNNFEKALEVVLSLTTSSKLVSQWDDRAFVLVINNLLQQNRLDLVAEIHKAIISHSMLFSNELSRVFDSSVTNTTTITDEQVIKQFTQEVHLIHIFNFKDSRGHQDQIFKVLC